jgi:hypothetical protein
MEDRRGRLAIRDCWQAAARGLDRRRCERNGSRTGWCAECGLVPAVEASEVHRFQVDYCKRTAWPQLPLIPRFDFGDDHI